MIREKQFDKDMEVRYWQHPAEASISSMYKKKIKDQYIYTLMEAKQTRASAQA